MKNLDLWDELAPVNAKFIKQYKNSATLTCVHPQWRLRRMTEVFGPIGQGWGYEITDRWSENDCVFVRLKVWYRHDDSPDPLWTGEQFGGTIFTRNPDDAYKSATTDALGKCVSQIGLAADVYMGQADSEYIIPASDSQRDEVTRLIRETSSSTLRLLKYLKIASLSELTHETAVKALKMLELKKEQSREDN
jgi:hypothetical protein